LPGIDLKPALVRGLETIDRDIDRAVSSYGEG
jgi:hypothetical protein